MGDISGIASASVFHFAGYSNNFLSSVYILLFQKLCRVQNYSEQSSQVGRGAPAPKLGVLNLPQHRQTGLYDYTAPYRYDRTQTTSLNEKHRLTNPRKLGPKGI